MQVSLSRAWRRRCSVSRRRFAAAIGNEYRYVAAPRWLRNGRAFSALVQVVFPHGRCGFALDGEPLWINSPEFRATSARAKIDGRSVGTQLLVGELRVGTGLAREVRWGER